VCGCAGALEAAQQEAAKERAARQRHEDVSGCMQLFWNVMQHYVLHAAASILEPHLLSSKHSCKHCMQLPECSKLSSTALSTSVTNYAMTALILTEQVY
jgi:hypothetical protein